MWIFQGIHRIRRPCALDFWPSICYFLVLLTRDPYFWGFLCICCLSVLSVFSGGFPPSSLPYRSTSSCSPWPSSSRAGTVDEQKSEKSLNWLIEASIISSHTYRYRSLSLQNNSWNRRQVRKWLPQFIILFEWCKYIYTYSHDNNILLRSRGLILFNNLMGVEGLPLYEKWWIHQQINSFDPLGCGLYCVSHPILKYIAHFWRLTIIRLVHGYQLDV